ncbi:DsrE family protein [Dyella sp. A6]|uniref:DsrE family protein n=1 Tax=Dyella aluminiiresistens TaxID=3069105 RepID=UPI002E7A6E40|nr:DsrE family protein [Dyella sp. A6]
MKRSILAVVCAFGLLLGAGAAAAPSQAITASGDFHQVPHAAYVPSSKRIYKAVFAMTKPSAKPDQVNPALERVARAVNLFAASGVPLSHLKFVAIAYGPATALTLDDAHYRAKFGVANPNLPVIAQLRKAGITVAVCGQAVIESHFQDAWIAKDVKIALSGLTTVIGLQQQGYALMPL